MDVATARTISLQGATGHLIDVQVDVADGVVATNLVGRVDASINEARDRCRAAVTNSGLKWPSTRRVTILLSPTDLPKRGPHFDLAIAVGVLAASGQVPRDTLDRAVLIGELTLEGRLRTVPGVLPMVLAARSRGIERVFVPEPQAQEAGLVPGMAVFGVRSLGQVVAELRGVELPDAQPVESGSGGSVLTWRGSDRLADVDMSDLLGMADARFAVEVAATGGHHLLLSGPKGAGKTSLAERLPGILPDLSLEESLELTAVHSLAGVLDSGAGLITRPPFLAPHHNTSKAALLGGGTGAVRPGEVSRSHCGVLFLDEFPLMNTDILEALRQPLESGEITIARGEETATYPARGMFVLACNPCPCGDYSPSVLDSRCVCPEVKRRDYRRKLTGPVMDRIDITRHVEPLRAHETGDPLSAPESSAAIRERVAQARNKQAQRYRGQGWRLNSHAPGHQLGRRWPLTPDAADALADETFAGRLTRRGAARVHRVAWTVADLVGTDQPGLRELDVALRLRNGTPLELDTLQGRCAG